MSLDPTATPVAYWKCTNASCTEVDISKAAYAEYENEVLCGGCGQQCVTAAAP